jgi:hypothetical protein
MAIFLLFLQHLVLPFMKRIVTYLLMKSSSLFQLPCVLLNPYHFSPSETGYCGISKITTILSSAFIAETALRRTVLSPCLVSLRCSSNSALLEKKAKQVSQTRTSLSLIDVEPLDSIQRREIKHD